MVAEFNGEVFAIPMELVKEIVCLRDPATAQRQGRSIVRIRERILATMRLDEVLTWNAAGNHSIRHAPCADCTPSRRAPDTLPGLAAAGFSHDARSGATLVVVGERGHDVGLVVDRVLGQEDVVIKSLAENYRDVPGIAGATILGDGRVSLILDIPALLAWSLTHGLETRRTAT